MLRQAWSWYLGLLAVGAGVFVGGSVALQSLRSAPSIEASPGRLLLALVLVPTVGALGLAVLSLVVPGFALAMLAAAPGLVVAAAVLLVRGEPAAAALLAICSLGVVASFFLASRVEAVIGVVFVGIVLAVWKVVSLPFSLLGRIGVKTAFVYCPTCGAEKRAIKRTRVALHGLYTLMTAGLWAPFWYRLAKRQRYRCVECNSPVEPGHMSASAISSTLPAGSSK